MPPVKVERDLAGCRRWSSGLGRTRPSRSWWLAVSRLPDRRTKASAGGRWPHHSEPRKRAFRRESSPCMCLQSHSSAASAHLPLDGDRVNVLRPLSLAGERDSLAVRRDLGTVSMPGPLVSRRAMPPCRTVRYSFSPLAEVSVYGSSVSLTASAGFLFG